MGDPCGKLPGTACPAQKPTNGYYGACIPIAGTWSIGSGHFARFNATLPTVGLNKRVPGLEKPVREAQWLLSAWNRSSPRRTFRPPASGS